MRYAICFIAFLLPCLCSAEAYVCVENGKKTISNIPCPDTSKTEKAIENDRTPVQRYENQGDNLRRQLRNVQDMRNEKTSAGSNEKSANTRTVATIEPRDEKGRTKAEACKQNWDALESVKAQARQRSTNYLRQRERQLNDERWKLGC